METIVFLSGNRKRGKGIGGIGSWKTAGRRDKEGSRCADCDTNIGGDGLIRIWIVKEGDNPYIFVTRLVDLIITTTFEGFCFKSYHCICHMETTRFPKDMSILFILEKMLQYVFAYAKIRIDLNVWLDKDHIISSIKWSIFNIISS